MKFKAHPTTYAGVNFRSRLEARWAAFFDIVQIKWEYEPYDLEGWSPDFSIIFPSGLSTLVEVKPIDWKKDGIFSCFEREDLQKAWRHVEHEKPILVLGLGPSTASKTYAAIGPWLEERSSGERDISEMIVLDKSDGDPGAKIDWVWREAGNRTQWRAPTRTR